MLHSDICSHQLYIKELIDAGAIILDFKYDMPRRALGVYRNIGKDVYDTFALLLNTILSKFVNNKYQLGLSFDGSSNVITKDAYLRNLANAAIEAQLPKYYILILSNMETVDLEDLHQYNTLVEMLHSELRYGMNIQSIALNYTAILLFYDKAWKGAGKDEFKAQIMQQVQKSEHPEKLALYKLLNNVELTESSPFGYSYSPLHSGSFSSSMSSSSSMASAAAPATASYAPMKTEDDEDEEMKAASNNPFARP